MKNINILIILGLFVLLAGTTQPAQAVLMMSWVPSVHSVRTSGASNPSEGQIIDSAAQLNAVAGKFEGLLNAYSVNGKQNIEKQISATVDDLSSSLNEFNAVLNEVYPDLTEEEQLVIVNAYSLLEVYFVDLVAKANSVFDKNLFWIEYGEPLNDTNESSSPDPDRHIVQFKSGLED